MPVDPNLYNPQDDMWPDLKNGRVALAPVRVGMDRTTGKMLIGWDHVQQSMYLIWATRFHERLVRRWVGSFVPHILGENAIQRTITRFYWAIASAIDLWEPNYSIQRVRVMDRADGTNLTSVEELRQGKLTTRNEGVYRPRAHLGDPTPETRRVVGIVGNGDGTWRGSK
jgi:phage baseplate assembly protein W